MSSLVQFWSLRVDPGSEAFLEQPIGFNIIITEVAFAEPIRVEHNVLLKASVETLLMDQPEVNGEKPSVQREVTIATFIPGQPRAQTVMAGFTSGDICYLQAIGAPLVVSGYIEKSSVKLSNFAPM